MKTKFLYILDEFPPAGMQIGIRALELSKRLIKKEIYPIILTKKVQKNRMFNKLLQKEIPSSLKIYRVHFFEFKLKKILLLLDFFFRFDFYLEWIPFAYYKAKKVIKKNKDITFIYAAGPPYYVHILGYLLKKKFKIPLVLEYSDPWSFNPYYDKGPILNTKINLFLERKTLLNSDLIISLSEVMNSFLKDKFPFIKNKKMFSIDQGINIEKIEKKTTNNTKIIFTFAGSIYGKRNIIPLLKIISKLKNENFFKDLPFLIKIYGKYSRKNLEYIIDKLNINDLVYLGDLIPRKKVFSEILKSNLALHIGENLNYPTLSFKIWDYLRMRKKILYLGREDSYTAQFLKKFELGIVIPINYLEKGKNILKNLLTDIKNKQFSNLIEEDVLYQFSWDIRALEFQEKVLNFFT